MAMPLFNMTELRGRLAPGQRLLGLDPGSRTIGVALSDVSLLLASPYGSLRRGKLAANAAEVSAMAGRENAAGLVVGLPLSMDGSAGPAAQASQVEKALHAHRAAALGHDVAARALARIACTAKAAF